MTMPEQSKESEIKFFDQFGEKKDYDVFDKHGYQRILGEFKKYIDPTKGLKVLDMGCGTGAFISKFQDSPYKLYGIDISPRCIEYARKKYPDISFSVGDIEATGYEDGAFDVILLSGVMHHFPCLDKLIKECHRVLKKGGVLLGYDLHCGNPFMWLYRCKKSPFYSSKGVTENERPISKKEVYDALKSCEYPVINVYCISGVTYKYFDHQLSSLILPVYNLIERTIDLPFLRQNIGSFIITYAKK